MCGNECNNVLRWNTKMVRSICSKAIIALCHMSSYIWQCYTYTVGKKMVEKFAPSAKQQEFNHKNRIVCVWEARLVKAVTLNLTQPLLHVIPVLSYFLHLCIDT